MSKPGYVFRGWYRDQNWAIECSFSDNEFIYFESNTTIYAKWNEVKTVEQAIKDVISINYPNKEIIVIDNCSKDGSAQIIKKLKKKKIKIILRKKNKNDD